MRRAITVTLLLVSAGCFATERSEDKLSFSLSAAGNYCSLVYRGNRILVRFDQAESNISAELAAQFGLVRKASEEHFNVVRDHQFIGLDILSRYDVEVDIIESTISFRSERIEPLNTDSKYALSANGNSFSVQIGRNSEYKMFDLSVLLFAGKIGEQTFKESYDGGELEDSPFRTRLIPIKKEFLSVFYHPGVVDQKTDTFGVYLTNASKMCISLRGNLVIGREDVGISNERKLFETMIGHYGVKYEKDKVFIDDEDISQQFPAFAGGEITEINGLPLVRFFERVKSEGIAWLKSSFSKGEKMTKVKIVRGVNELVLNVKINLGD